MIKKIGLLLAGLMGMYALEACVVVDCTNDPNNAACANTAGSGGSGGKDVSSSSSGTAGAGVGGGGGKGGAGGAPACVNTCIEVASDNTLTPCPGTPAEKAWTELSTCVCMTGMPDGCSDVCKDNRCAGMTSSADCDKCVQQGACMGALAACAM